MENKEELVTQFLEHLRKTVFVRSTNSVTLETEELNPAIEDREETVLIDGEWDKQDIIAALTLADKQGYMRAKVEGVDENTSDGYHTFKELYDFRRAYNATLFNEWASQGKYNVHKSQRHGDGELCFGRDDYFIVMATTPFGQISNHYPISDWDLFKCEAREKADVWDGHTSKDVEQRLLLASQAHNAISKLKEI